MSSTDSWTLIGVTILVVLLLFYLSKKMICGSNGNGQPGESISSTGGSGTSGTNGEAQEDPVVDTDGYLPYRYQYDPSHHHRYQESFYGNGGSNHHHQQQHQHHHHPSDVSILEGAGYNCMNLGARTTTNTATSLDNLDHHPHNHQTRDDTSELIVPIEVSVVSDVNNTPNNTTPTDTTTTTSTTPSVAATSGSMMISNRSRSSMTMGRKNIIETELRAQIIKMVQAEREVRRLAHLLSIEQGLNGEDYIAAAFRNNLLYPQHHHYQQHYYHQQLQLQNQAQPQHRGVLASGELILSAQSLPHDHNNHLNHNHHHQVQLQNLQEQLPPLRVVGGVSGNDDNNLDGDLLDSDQPPPYDQCVP